MPTRSASSCNPIPGANPCQDQCNAHARRTGPGKPAAAAAASSKRSNATPPRPPARPPRAPPKPARSRCRRWSAWPTWRAFLACPSLRSSRPCSPTARSQPSTRHWTMTRLPWWPRISASRFASNAWQPRPRPRPPQQRLRPRSRRPSLIARRSPLHPAPLPRKQRTRASSNQGRRW